MSPPHGATSKQSYDLPSSQPTASLRNSNLVRLYLWVALLILSSYALGYDGSLLNGLQALPQWQRDFDHPTGNILGVLNMSGQLGALVGPWFFQAIADRYGRVRSLHIASIVGILGGCLSIIKTPSSPVAQRAVFSTARSIISIGASAGPVSSAVLIAELAHPRHRSATVSLYMSGYYIGSVVAAWVTFGTLYWTASSWAWRLPGLLQALPFILQLVLLPWCPESPRWLVYQGRQQEARSLLAYYHAEGDESDPLVRFQIDEIQQAIQLEKLASEQSAYTDLFKTRGNRWRLWILVTMAFSSQWCGNSIGSYYLSPILGTLGITKPLDQAGLNVGLSIFNLIVAVVASLRSDRWGRRPMLLTSASGMLTSFVIITILSARYDATRDGSFGVAVIVFLFVFFGFYSSALTPYLFAYPAEVLQYSLRARGMALLTWLTSIALIFNIWINPIALESIGWRLYLVYIGVLVLILINFHFAYPETKGRTIEEVAEIFDGHSVLDPVLPASGPPSPGSVTIHSAKDQHKDEKPTISIA